MPGRGTEGGDAGTGEAERRGLRHGVDLEELRADHVLQRVDPVARGEAAFGGGTEGSQSLSLDQVGGTEGAERELGQAFVAGDRRTPAAGAWPALDIRPRPASVHLHDLRATLLGDVLALAPESRSGQQGL